MTMSLISDVNGFLDSISYDFSSVDETIVELYSSVIKNYESLREFRVEMDFYGFQNPYYVIKGVRDSWKDPFFRQTATKKKIAFDRIQYSIAAHRIALAHFGEALEVRIDKRRLLGDKALDAIKGGSGPYIINPDGVFNFSVLTHLPYRGEYMLLLSDLPKRERVSYRKIVGALGQRQRPDASAARSHMYTRRDGAKKQSLSLGHDAGGVVGKRFMRHDNGPSHQSNELIVDKYVRKCLGICYAPLSYSVFINDLLLYYLKKSYYERERHTSIFPGVDPVADLSLFGKYAKALEKKEEVERKLEGLKIHEKSSLVGAVAFYLICEDMKLTRKMFHCSAQDVERAVEKFKKLGLLEGKPLIAKRTQDFLEFLKAER